MATMSQEIHLQVLARPLPDGTFRARIFEGGVMTWQCTHPHATIEVAWECGRRRADELRAAYAMPAEKNAS